MIEQIEERLNSEARTINNWSFRNHRGYVTAFSVRRTPKTRANSVLDRFATVTTDIRLPRYCSPDLLFFVALWTIFEPIYFT